MSFLRHCDHSYSFTGYHDQVILWVNNFNQFEQNSAEGSVPGKDLWMTVTWKWEKAVDIIDTNWVQTFAFALVFAACVTLFNISIQVIIPGLRVETSNLRDSSTLKSLFFLCIRNYILSVVLPGILLKCMFPSSTYKLQYYVTVWLCDSAPLLVHF